MGFSLDYKDIDKYYQTIMRATKDFDKFLKKFLSRMAMEVLRETKLKTPVDTGSLRSAWQVSNIQGSETDIYVEFSNPMEYATEIEYGHRIVVHDIEVGWYEGRFMLKTSMENIMNKIPLRYAFEFSKYCEERGWKHD